VQQKISELFLYLFLTLTGVTMTNFEPLIAAQKSAVEGIFNLSNTLFDSAQKLVELNLQATKASMQEAQANATAAVAAKDPQAVIALQAAALKAAPEKAASYLRHVYNITSASSTEVRAFAEEAGAKAKADMTTMVDAAIKNAPAGSENAVAMVKSAVTAANNAFETAQQATKQATAKAVQAVEAQLAKVAA